MNEKIKQLALQAELLQEQEGDVYLLEHATGELEKFAELIVKECADLASSYNIYGRGRPWNLIIKEHFGLAITDADIPPYLRDTK